MRRFLKFEGKTMTQEELDTLMAEADNMPEADGATKDAPEQEKPIFSVSEELDEDGFPKDYRVDAQKHWPPPPPSADHKMVQQLDDVTRDSEEKATQVLDMLDSINNLLMDGEEEATGIKDVKNLAQSFLISQVLLSKKTNAKVP